MGDSANKFKLDAETFLQFADQALTGFIVFDSAKGSCEYANQMAIDTLDCRDEISNLKIDKLFPEPNTHNKFRPFNAELLNFEGIFQEILMKKYSGGKFVASLGVRKVKVDQGDFVFLMIQDMTVQVKLQREVEAKQIQINAAYAELLQQNQQLKDLDRAKNKFIALVTHELRTPVSGIVSTSEVLKMKLYDTDAQRDEFIGMIHSEGIHLLELVNDILDFAKIQAGKMDFFVEQKDVLPLLEHEVEVLQNMADQHQIKLNIQTVTINSGCYFDELRLKQVFANILNNAIKYNRPGGQVTIWIEEKDANLVIYVKDTGKGIKAEDQPKVFDEFETLGKISLHNKGTGLGMPITRRLLQGMGGTIQLSSEVGVGTTFWITLPCERVLDASMYRSRGESGSGDFAA